MPRLVIYVDFEDDSDFVFFKERMVDAVDEVVTIALYGDEDIGEPARADGSITISWDTED